MEANSQLLRYAFAPSSFYPRCKYTDKEQRCWPLSLNFSFPLFSTSFG